MCRKAVVSQRADSPLVRGCSADRSQYRVQDAAQPIILDHNHVSDIFFRIVRAASRIDAPAATDLGFGVMTSRMV